MPTELSSYLSSLLRPVVAMITAGVLGLIILERPSSGGSSVEFKRCIKGSVFAELTFSTDEMSKSIWNYTDDVFPSGRPLNSALRGGRKLSPEMKTEKERLLLVLASLKPVSRVTFRGMSYNSFLGLGRKFVQENWIVGAPISDPAFLSSAGTLERAQSFLGQDDGVVFEIHGKSGRDVSAYSRWWKEGEVIFLPNTRFRVVSVSDGSYWRHRLVFYKYIVVEEVDEAEAEDSQTQHRD